VALIRHVVAVEDTWCYRVCAEADEEVIAAIIAVEENFYLNRATCRHRDFFSIDNTWPKLNPRLPCLEGSSQNKNVASVASRATLTSFTALRRTRSVCSVARWATTGDAVVLQDSNDMPPRELPGVFTEVFVLRIRTNNHVNMLL